MKHYSPLRLLAAVIVTIASAPLLNAQMIPNSYNLEDNYMNAGFDASGNFFTDHSASQFLLSEVPRGGGRKDIYTASLWLSAFDSANNLHLAGNRYWDNGKDYFPGPLGNNSDSTKQYCSNVFLVTAADLSTFQALSFPTTWANVPASIKDWPARGNTYLDTFLSVSINEDLAPFIDVDHDGIYNPLKGDYPAFCGDQALFFVYNDSAGVHGETGGAILGVEVKALAFEFVAPGSVPEKEALNNTVFMHLEVVNKSPLNYNNFSLGWWEDPDVGCFSNDRVGCDTARNLMFAYNGATPDVDCSPENGYAPYQVAHGAIMLNKNLDDFVYFTNGAPAAQTDPVTATQYQQYLTGYWTDGTPFTNGGTGYGGNQATAFCFPGDPNNLSQWSEVQVADSLPPGDRRFMGATYAPGFNSGETKIYDLALLTSYDSSGTTTMFQIVDTLKRDADIVRALYNSYISHCVDSITAADSIPTGIKTIATTGSPWLSVFPNPAHSSITIQSPGNIQVLELRNMDGQKVAQLENIPALYILDVSKLAKGIYMLSATSNGKTGIRKVVIE